MEIFTQQERRRAFSQLAWNRPPLKCTTLYYPGEGEVGEHECNIPKRGYRCFD